MQVPGRASKHPSLPECQQQRQARTLTPPPLRTVEQPQACSTCRSCMAASVAEHSACAWSSPQALSTRVPEAETSAHLESASASHHGVAASLLHQSELHGASGCRSQCRCLVLAMSTLHWSAGGKDHPLAPCPSLLSMSLAFLNSVLTRTPGNFQRGPETLF